LENFRKAAVVGLILSSALLLSACNIYRANSSSSQNAQSEPTTVETSSNETNGSVTITATDSGFSPNMVKIKAGESITWVNNTSSELQVGSAKHPTHTENPELTGGNFVLSLAPGESKTVSVGNKIGTWGYHDHSNPSANGQVVIE